MALRIRVLSESSGGVAFTAGDRRRQLSTTLNAALREKGRVYFGPFCQAAACANCRSRMKSVVGLPLLVSHS
jgi:hypothetical protein